MKFKSQVLTQASGSIGGVTYSHNKGGMYQRARSTPTNPGSTFQSAIRGFVSALTGLWNNTLTTAERAGWIIYADQVPLVDRLGEQMQVTGLNMYVRSNVPRLQAGLARVDTPPTTFNLGTFTNPSFAVDAATDDVDVSFTATDAWANETGGAMLILASRPQNPSINYFKGPYRLAGSILGDTTTPPTSPATIVLPFPVVVGQKVFFQARTTLADGRLAAFFRSVDTA